MRGRHAATGFPDGSGAIREAGLWVLMMPSGDPLRVPDEHRPGRYLRRLFPTPEDAVREIVRLGLGYATTPTEGNGHDA